MNHLIEEIYACGLGDQPTREDQNGVISCLTDSIERLERKLETQLTGDALADFRDYRDCRNERSKRECLREFQIGFCVGGRIVMEMTVL